MKLAELNLLDQERFVDRLGWIFEHSPWVAERAWHARPFASLDELQKAMCAEVDCADPSEQVALLRAHPDLGTRAKVSAASAGEQGGVGLDRLTPEEFAHLTRLNSEYKAKFGFPFLFAVKGSTKYDILRALEERVQATPESEYREALRQVYRIALFRLETALT
jgi:2-oxo-4-hydroxy-4-carboxy-5-ureidoimidazoline decarboxylase